MNFFSGSLRLSLEKGNAKTLASSALVIRTVFCRTASFAQNTTGVQSEQSQSSIHYTIPPSLLDSLHSGKITNILSLMTRFPTDSTIALPLGLRDESKETQEKHQRYDTWRQQGHPALFQLVGKVATAKTPDPGALALTNEYGETAYYHLAMMAAHQNLINDAPAGIPPLPYDTFVKFIKANEERHQKVAHKTLNDPAYLPFDGQFMHPVGKRINEQIDSFLADHKIYVSNIMNQDNNETGSELAMLARAIEYEKTHKNSHTLYWCIEFIKQLNKSSFYSAPKREAMKQILQRTERDRKKNPKKIIGFIKGFCTIFLGEK